MAKCHRNDEASVVLDHSTGSGSDSGFKIWSAFTGGSFRHKIIDTMCCDGGGATAASDKPTQKEPEKRPKCRFVSKKNGGSKRLSELLRLPESWNENEDKEVKKKVKALEDMKRVVKRLQCDDVLWGAKEVRWLTKDDSEARTTLALLRVILT